MLVVDGHNSHYTAELLDYAREHHITVLAYPPHTSHALQGHDVALFAPFKRRFVGSFEHWERSHGERVTKYSFLRVLEEPFLLTFTTKNIQKAFEATGIWPFNSEIIHPSKMQPSRALAYKDSSLTQSSPVKAMLAAFYSTPPTSINAMEQLTLDITKQPLAKPMFNSPLRKARVARGLIRGTSASLLVEENLINSDFHLATPHYIHPTSPLPRLLGNLVKANKLPGIDKTDQTDLRHENQLLREQLLETAVKYQKVCISLQAANTTLVLEHLYNKALKLTLSNKENKKKSKRHIVFPSGKG